jgi:tRNA(fMet)-specific endonuclease VapC
MKRYMLDTNTVSRLLNADAAVARRVESVAMASLCVSAITDGELLFGLAKRPDAKRLHIAVRELMRRIDVLPWDSRTADRYGIVRADMVRRGKILAPLDMLIAAHALDMDAVLVSNDQVFREVPGLDLQDWTA